MKHIARAALSVAAASFATTLTPGPVAADPVADFYAIQAVWSFLFLFTAFLGLLSALALLPGRATAWQRFVFLASVGRRGAWRDPMAASDPVTEKAIAELRTRIERETDPVLKEGWAALLKLRHDRARLKQELEASHNRLQDLGSAVRVVAAIGVVCFSVLSVGFLLPVVAGALSRETLSLGPGAGSIKLDTEPGLFWFNMGASLVISALMALGAFRAARLLRSGDVSP
jgi:hypothetical protein